MRDTLTRHVQALAEIPGKQDLVTVLRAIGGRLSSQPLITAGLVITGAGGTTAKIGSTDYLGIVNGKLVTIAANTVMPSLAGLTITANRYNVAVFFTDVNGNRSVAFGVEGAVPGAVIFPHFPENVALIGFLLITHTSTFTGGTTALDAATTKYVSPVGALDPSILL